MDPETLAKERRKNKERQQRYREKKKQLELQEYLEAERKRKRQQRYMRKLLMQPEALAEERRKAKERQRIYRENRKIILNQKSDGGDGIDATAVIMLPHECDIDFDNATTSSGNTMNFDICTTSTGNSMNVDYSCGNSAAAVQFSFVDKIKIDKNQSRLENASLLDNPQADIQNIETAAYSPAANLNLNALSSSPPSPSIPVDIIKIEEEQIMD